MLCSISGELPQEPVVAKTTGLLFEKRLILKAIKDDGKCPVSGSDLTEQDLIPITSNPVVPVRSAGPATVNGLLHTLQQEWDETVLEAFTLRQQLDTTRKELAHALYQYDAACRVIARIMKERDEAYQLLKDFQANGSTHSISNHAGSSADEMEIATEEGINSSVLEEWKEVCDRLSASRKGRKAPATLATKDEISHFQENAQFVATSSSSTASINTIALKEDESHSLLASGSTDKSILVTDVSNSKYSTVCKLNGHKGGVTRVAFSPVSVDVIFSGSEDKTLRIWKSNNSGGYSEAFSYSHAAPVNGVAVHPSGNYVVTTAEEAKWSIVDANRGVCLKSVMEEDNNGFVYSDAQFHPDGLILGTGTNNGECRIWDIREQKRVASLKDSDIAANIALSALNFSENGYHVAAGYADGNVKIWDLRKLKCLKTSSIGSRGVTSVAFDYSGVYLGIGGSGSNGNHLQVNAVKEWNSVLALPDAHSDVVTSIAWGADAKTLYTSSQDNIVRVFSTST